MFLLFLLNFDQGPSHSPFHEFDTSVRRGRGIGRLSRGGLGKISQGGTHVLRVLGMFTWKSNSQQKD